MPRLYIITWASNRDAMERDGWALVKVYSLTGCHHAPSALFWRAG